MTGDGDHFEIYGTTIAEQQPVQLHAGRLTADLLGGNLRAIAYDGHEVLRAVSYLVRDRDWGTYSPEISKLTIEQRDDGFRVSYVARCHGPDGADLFVTVGISADLSGILTFEADALSPSGFETNRCGFCILHPITGVAGMPVEVEHVDGSVEETCFPDLIEPWQPFKDMRAISHHVMPDVMARCSMEGDTFEMEDQRNWSDASYKTYVRPLALPWPYQIPAGTPVSQRIVLTITDDRAALPAPASVGDKSPTVFIGRGTQTGVMPAIGLIIMPDEAKATLAAQALLSDIGPQELLFHFDPIAGHGCEALSDFAAIVAGHAGTCTLEIALPCRQAPSLETAEIATMLRASGFAPDAIMISPSVDRQSTPPGSKWPECPPLEEVYAAAQAAFPGIRLGGGMLSYFTELNRKRVPAAALDFISHCTNPIVHAADDTSVMQTLEALPFITRSVRAIYGNRPYRIGPSTIAMRQNPYGSRTMSNPGGDRMPMANTDPRHNGRFAEAFALAYAAQVLDAGLECLTLSALTGPFGLIAGKSEASAEGTARPLLRTIKTLARVAGSSWQECASSAPGKILAFTTRSASGRHLHLVNISMAHQLVNIDALDASAGTLTLGPYATAFLPLSD